MPAVYMGTMMESRDIKWRPKFTSGLSDEGPEDQRLIIEFAGPLSGLSWVTLTSYGYAIDLDALGASVPVMFDKSWLRNKGFRKAGLTETSNQKYIIDIQL